MYLVRVVYVGFVVLCNLDSLGWSILLLLGCSVGFSVRSIEEVSIIWQDLHQGIMGWQVVSIFMKL